METYSIENVINESKTVKPRLLLHVCCAPCASGVLDALTFFDVTLFFYNPNIMPENEFNLREKAVKTLVSHYNGIKLIVPEQNGVEYTGLVKGYEQCAEGGKRCELCFKLRLEKTAEFLSKNREKYDFFATTLTVSPHKNAAVINKIGADAANKYDVIYLSSDFKKKDGFLKSIINSKALNLYRQTYCGCKFE